MIGLAQTRWGYALIALVSAAVYGGGVGNDFTFDDRALIAEDYRIVSGDWSGILSQSYWGDTGDGLYRPLTTASYALNYLVTGFTASGFHVINLLLHIASSCLLMGIARLLVGPNAAFLGGLLFALHPGPSEAIFSVVGRAELLAFSCGAAGISLWLKAKVTPTRQACLLIACSGCLLASILAKENGMAFGLGLAAYAIALNHRDWVGWMIPLSAVVAGILVKWWAIGTLQPVGIGYLDNPLAYVSDLARAFHGLGLIVRAVFKLIFPWPLVADYSPNQIPLFSDLNDLELLLPAAFVATSGVGIFYLIKIQPKNLLITGTGICALLMVSNVFVATGTIFAERLLYIPSGAFCIGTGWSLNRLKHRWTIWFLVVWLAVSGGILWQRAGDWQDDLALFASAVENHPKSARSHYGLGLALHRQYHAAGRASRSDTASLDRALDSYVRAIALYPRYVEAQFNRAALLVERGRVEGAISAYGKVLELRPGHFKARFALSLLEQHRGHLALAERLMHQLHDEQPQDLEVLAGLAMLWWQMERGDEARALVRETLVRVPQNVKLRELARYFNREPP
jgi:hypothetical protein